MTTGTFPTTYPFEAYLADGRAVEVIAKDGGDYLVRHVYEDANTGEPRYGDVDEVASVYLTPSTEKINTEIAALNAKAAELRRHRQWVEHRAEEA